MFDQPHSQIHQNPTPNFSQSRSQVPIMSHGEKESEAEFLQSIEVIQTIVDEVFEEDEEIMTVPLDESDPFTTSRPMVVLDALPSSYDNYQIPPQALSSQQPVPVSLPQQSELPSMRTDDRPRFKVRTLKALAFDLNDAIRRYHLKAQGFGKFKHKVFVELQHLQTVKF